MFFNFAKQGNPSIKHDSSFHTHYKQALAEIRDALSRLEARVEFTEAKSKAQDEIQQMNARKFDQVNESVGELKEMFKEMSEAKKAVEVEFSKLEALVKSLEPQELLRGVNSVKKQFFSVDGKLNLLNRQHQHLKREFEKFDHKLRVFKGEDEILKIQSRTVKDLNDTRRMSQIVDMHASKAENNFIKIKERTEKVQQEIAGLGQLRDELLGMKQEIAPLLDKLKATPESELIDEMRSHVEELADVVIETLAKLKSRHDETEANVKLLMRDRQGVKKRMRHSSAKAVKRHGRK